MSAIPPPSRLAPARGGTATFWLAAALYAALLTAMWFAAHAFGVAQRLGEHWLPGFLTFALLFLPFWAFGFGLAAPLRRRLISPAARIAAPAALLVPYLLFAVATSTVQLRYVVFLLGIPVGLAALFETAGRAPAAPQAASPGSAIASEPGAAAARLGWPDAIALPVLGLPIMLNWLSGAFPYPGLGSNFAKLLLVDAALYAYLVVRQFPGVGYDFRLRARDWAIGGREWAWFAPIAIGLGLALHFIRFRPGWPPLSHALGAWLATFLFVAVPEEFFFRGLLQNLLETRCGRTPALVLASALFGAAHFHHPPVPNWRYMLLAALAGIFYGRAWRDRRRVGCSAITHASVDVVWGLWFR